MDLSLMKYMVALLPHRPAPSQSSVLMFPGKSKLAPPNGAVCQKRRPVPYGIEASD
jgi:hypothetical protein